MVARYLGQSMITMIQGHMSLRALLHEIMPSNKLHL